MLFDVLNLSASADELDLAGSGMILTRGNSADSLTSGSYTLPIAYHPTETIQAAGVNAERFALSPHFGNETINGFAASGAGDDTIQFSLSNFSYLNSGMTQAQDLAAVLANATSGASGTTIANAYADTLSLPGISATITASFSQFKIV